MAYDQQTCWCDGCGVEITWGPLLKGERTYCCEECLQGWACRCRARQELEDDRRQSNAAAVPASYSQY
jgi:hypothetical protein